DNGPVLRRERLDVSSAVLVRFSERVLGALRREQDARLGKRDPSPLVRRQYDKERASVASVVPSSLVASDGAAASAPNSHPIRLTIPILEVSCRQPTPPSLGVSSSLLRRVSSSSNGHFTLHSSCPLMQCTS